MTEDLIQLPEISEVKELIDIAKTDINAAIKEDAELEPQGKLVLEVLSIIEEKVAKQKDLNALSPKEKISIAAHLNFFHSLLEDFFFNEDFDDEDFDDEEDIEEEDDQ